MGEACDLCACSCWNDRNDAYSFVGNCNFFSREGFSGERFTSKELFDTGYKMSVSFQTPMLNVNYTFINVHGYVNFPHLDIFLRTVRRPLTRTVRTT